jgi:hemerythrin-like domain-containing protein
MLRDKSLIPLSHQHQHALALCVRIERASPIDSADLAVWQSEISLIVRHEIRVHFGAEERVLFPQARRFEELISLVEELVQDHAVLRDSFERAEQGAMSATEVSAFAHLLSAHIRKEERRLFERMQELMDKVELAQVGREIEDALKDAEQACILPTAATKLRPAEATSRHTNQAPKHGRNSSPHSG